MPLKIKQVTVWFWRCDGPDCAVEESARTPDMPSGWVTLPSDKVSVDRNPVFHCVACKEAWVKAQRQ